MCRIIRFLAGFTVGAVAGAAAALLLAPGAGDELRGALRERLQVTIEEARQAAADTRAEVQRQFAEAKQLRPRQTQDA